jgi:hypothetical protein
MTKKSKVFGLAFILVTVAAIVAVPPWQRERANRIYDKYEKQLQSLDNRENDASAPLAQGHVVGLDSMAGMAQEMQAINNELLDVRNAYAKECEAAFIWKSIYADVWVKRNGFNEK